MASTTEGLAGAREGPPPLPRRPWFVDRVDKLLLLLFFFGGFGLILLVKLAGRSFVTWRGEPVEPRLLAAMLAAILLLAYAALASLTRTFKLHPERLGDNCYYLGLLYTLASLMAALVELERVPAEARGALVESLLASFGVALSSTILGIALRVWFVQMRREIEDLEAELQRELQEAARRLKDQLLFAITDLESFRLRTQQVLEQRLAEATSAVVEPLAARTREFSQSTRAILAAADELAEKLRGVEVPHDLYARPAALLQGAVADFRSAVATLEETARRTSSALEQEVAALEVRLAGLATPIAQLSQGLQAAAAAGRGLESLASQVDPLRVKLSELAGSLDQLVAAARDDAREIRGLRDQIRADLVEYHRAQRELGGTLVAVADGVVRRLEG